MTDGRRANMFVFGAIAAIVLVSYLRPLALGDTFVLRDHITLTVPSRAHLAESLRAGELPEWWDGVGLGVPFAANPINGVTYPPAWLVAALPLGHGADVLAILHVLLLGIGTALVARRLGADPLGAVVAAGVAMTCGYTTSMIVNGIPLLTMAWTPWVAWAADRLAARPGARAAAVLAAFVAAQLSSGDPAGMITSGWLAVLWVVARAERRGRALAYLAGGFAAALALAAVAVMPALFWVGETQRAGGIAVDDAATWSLHPARMLEWVWPNALGDPADPRRDLARVYASTGADDLMDPGWSLSLFVGAPVLLLAFIGALRPRARTRGLLIGSAVFVALALGTFTPLYPAYRFLALPERLVRYPERHVVGALVIWAALAGVGFTALFGAEPERRRWWKVAVAVVGGLGALVLAGAVAGKAIESTVGDRLDARGAWEAMMSGGLTAMVVAGVVAAAIALRRWPRYRTVAPALAAAVIVGHLIGHGWSVQPLLDRDRVADVPALLSGIDAPGEGPRPRIYRHPSMTPFGDFDGRPALVAALYDGAVANSATRFGYAYVPGYDPVGSGRLKPVWEAGARHGGRLIDLFDIDYRVARARDGELTLVRQALRRPRAFVTARWQWIEDGDDAALYASLFGASLDRELVRLAGRGPAAAADAPGGLGPCRFATYRPEHVVLECTADAPGYAVLLDAWAPGWSATVDGRAAPIERADGVVRAVPIAAGVHVIEMTYRTPGLRLGLLISLIAWLGWGALMWQARRRGWR